MKNNDLHRYDDMLNLSAPEPKTRPRMSMENRAAQFAGFRALTGHEELLEKTERKSREDWEE